tara:strand:- start:4238 stop:4756 length:519 start_codon:yes stop_codon:yes gene_type:complete
MVNGTILSSPLFIEIILPFILVFAVVFAILQKTNILGDGKRQIDAIVALVIGLIVIAFGQAVDIIIYLMPVLAVSVVVLLVFMILYGMVFKEGEFAIPKGVKGVIGVLAAIVVVVAILIITGWWGRLVDYIFLEGDSSGIIANIVFILIAGVAIGVVWWGGGKGKGKEDKKE